MASIIYSKGKIEAKVAESWKEKAMGLRLKQTGSMLFKLEEKNRPIIDMVLVPRKLQIIFLSENMKVQQIIHAEPGLNTYKPENKCKYFLETFHFTEIEPGEVIRVKNF